MTAEKTESPFKAEVLFVGALLGIPASISTVLLILGSISSLHFGWLAAFKPYLQTCVALAAMVWLAYLAIDYIALRKLTRSLIEKISNEESDRKKFENSLQKQLADLATELVRTTSATNVQCDYRIGNLSTEFEAKLKKEVDSRVGGEQIDRMRINELEGRISKLEQAEAAINSIG